MATMVDLIEFACGRRPVIILQEDGDTETMVGAYCDLPIDEAEGRPFLNAGRAELAIQAKPVRS